MSVRGNLWKLGVIRALSGFMTMMPIVVLFFQENGLSMQQVLWLQAVFALAIVIGEVPSGYFADVTGRKLSILIGFGLAVPAYVFYALSHSFTQFVLVEILLGLSVSFVSGADSALLYDSLLETKKEGEFKKIEGRQLSFFSVSEGVASLLGGALALISLRVPIWAEAVTVALAFLLALTLREPHRHGPDRSEGDLKSLIAIVKYSLHGHPEIRSLIYHSAWIFTATFIAVWFVQPFLKNAGLPLAWFGVAWALLQFAVAAFLWSAHGVEKFLGKKTTLLMLLPLAGLGYLLLGLVPALWGALFLLPLYFVRGVAQPVLRDYVNALVSSSHRATVLSAQSLVGRLFFVVLGPLSGWVADRYSMGTAFLALAGLFLLVGALYFASRLSRISV